MGSVGEERMYPLTRPRGHKVPVPRWSLRFPDSVSHVYTLYVGVQCRSGSTDIQSVVEGIIEERLSGDNDSKPPAIDTFRVTDGFDLKVNQSNSPSLHDAYIYISDDRDHESGLHIGHQAKHSKRP